MEGWRDGGTLLIYLRYGGRESWRLDADVVTWRYGVPEARCVRADVEA